MKKALFLLCVLAIITGCNRSDEKISEEKIALYTSYYQAVLNNTEFLDYSNYFTVSSEVSKKSDGTYLYYVSIDTPSIAMYDVELIVLEGLTDMQEREMMPSLGLFEDKTYNMIPYQVNAEKGFVKGMTVSGDVVDPSVPLYCLITWKDLGQLNQSREFIKIHLDYIDTSGGQIHETEE